MGDKIRVENATENYKFGRIERFDNLSKNRGQDANEKDKNVRIEKYYN